MKQETFYQLEKNIALCVEKIEEIQESEEKGAAQKIKILREKIAKEWGSLKPKLTPLHVVQIARHPKRPYTLDY